MITTNNITTNIKPFTVHSMSGNVTTQSQQQITSGGLDTNVETDPIFRHSAAYNITDTDIQRWDAASGGIDLSAYVTKSELSAQAYLTSESDPIFSASPAATITYEDIELWNSGGSIDLSSYITKDELYEQSYITSDALNGMSYVSHEFLSSQAYLTSEVEPAFNSSPASSITSTDISNWNNAAGTLDMSAYCTKAELAAQSYITATTLDSCGYLTSDVLSSQGYITGNVLSSQSYITQQVLSEQSYLTVEVEPAFNASPAATITAEDITRWDSGGGDLSLYVQKSELSEQAYITPAQLYSMSYITQSDIVFPDYSSTYQAVGDYVTKSQLSDQSYVQFSSVTENNKYIIYDGSIATTAQMNQTTYTGAPLHSSVLIQAQDIYNVCSAGIQSHISYNGTSYTATTNFSANAPVNGESRARFSADYVELISGKSLIIRNQDGTYRCGISFSSFDGKLMLFPSNGISLQYKGTQSFIASYTYVLEQMNDFVVSQAYITPAALAAMAYVKQSDIVFPDYQNTYQAKGDYVTPTELINQSYITINDVTFPDYQNTYQSKGDYVTPTQLVNQSYVTKSDLSAQSYVTQSTVVFPDYQNTYQAKGDYVTPTQLVAQSYVTTSDLVSQSYITTSELVSQSYITPTQLVSQSYVTTNDLVAQSYATKSYVANYVEDAIHEPVVVWETNGVGLTALETNMSASPNWQLTNLDMTPYKHIKIYSRSNQKSGTTASASTTAAMVLEMSLDPRAAGPYGGHYIGSTVSQKPNDSNRLATLTCAVSADKTSFAVLRMTSLYGTAATSNSDVNAYVFKIVGYYDEIGGIDTSGDLSDYVSKVELSQQAYITSTALSNQAYVTSTALSNQAYVTSTSLQNMSYVTTTDLSNCGYVQIRLVTQAQYQDRQDNILYIITDAPPIS